MGQETDIPTIEQMLLFGEVALPRDGAQTLTSQGLENGSNLTLVRLHAPQGAWKGIYHSRPSSPYMYEMRLDCNKWNWISDGEQHHLEFEMEYTVLKHPQSDAVNAVAVEVYRVDFNWQESSLKGKGVRTYKRSES